MQLKIQKGRTTPVASEACAQTVGVGKEASLRIFIDFWSLVVSHNYPSVAETFNKRYYIIIYSPCQVKKFFFFLSYVIHLCQIQAFDKLTLQNLSLEYEFFVNTRKNP